MFHLEVVVFTYIIIDLESSCCRELHILKFKKYLLGPGIYRFIIPT